MASETSQLHFLMIPFMSQSHLIPITDTAKLLAQRGLTVTIITTPLNAIHYKKVINNAANSNLKVHLVEFQFPFREARLPQGCENLDSLSNLDLVKNFIEASRMLEKPLEDFLREFKPPANCIISSSALPWTLKVARRFNIPWMVYHTISCFTLSRSHRILRNKVHGSIESESEPSVVGMPDGMVPLAATLKESLGHISNLIEELQEAELFASGIVINSFEELEPIYVEDYKKMRNSNVWCAMASDINQPHFVLIPLMAQGHMIPMIDMARLLAEHGVLVSLVTTPQNASRVQSTIQRANESGFSIRLVQIPFPCKDVGLPLGCENLDSVPSKNLIRKFYIAIDKLQQPLEKYLEENKPSPSCIISDKYVYWTSLTAKKFHVPRLVFHGMGCFSLLSSHNVKLYKAHHSVSSDRDPFDIPGLPHKIQITKAQLPGEFVKSQDFDDIRELIREAETSAYGVVLNSFDSLEHGYIEDYTRVLNKMVWPIGPVSLCNKTNAEKFERGDKASIDEKQCLQWLDSKKQCSVLYVCLGSQCRLIPTQLIELGLGLEASKHPFIWVIKKGERFPDLESGLQKENFEDRIKGRGLLIKGWAPQILILSHPAIRGFLSHCGWNSTIEAACSGVPMLTWPMFAEQFLNEKLITEVLKIGIRMGIEAPVRWGDEEKVGILVTKSEVEIAVNRLMDGREGEMPRQRARQLGEKARRAMEAGGASNFNISLMIQEIMNLNAQEKCHK
ncbi:UDP-glucuronosyl/UDP-glucosyltransferase [Dillenia turbinata]|uniref:UDP-glucuronosyl/UDP-glucosyltransferase n=1 Tax=Dillenia turbinata TaxID=194707 RepID=A0AAN8VYH6_9MAGN